ncbi:MAG: hypothetical protein KGI52_18230 [Burkholderiales bacterium]|nr:hypothetical protein [Burkholderiales bacterium]
MRTLHLFAGAGGGLLADLILGHTPIAAVEQDPYCCAVLRERAAYGWSPPDVGVCRVVDELADRVHRIKALGNGQVPLQAAAAWLILTEQS